MTKSNSTGRKNTNRNSNTVSGRASKHTSSKQTPVKKQVSREDQELWYEVGLIVLFAFMVFLFLCNFGLVGPIGVFFKNIMFGLFGLTAYIVPVLLFIGIFFGWVNQKHPAVKRKMISGAVFCLLLGAVAEFIAGRLKSMDGYHPIEIYKASVEHADGGGMLGGSIAYFLYRLLDTTGSILVIIVLGIICMVLITEKSFVKGVQKTGRAVAGRVRSDTQSMREYAAERAQNREAVRYEQLRLKDEELHGKEEPAKPALPDRSKKVTGVNFRSIFSKLGEEEEKEKDLLDFESFGTSDSSINDSSISDGSMSREAETAQSASSGDSSDLTNSGVSYQVSKETITRLLPETDELHELRPKTRYYEEETLHSVRKNYVHTENEIEPDEAAHRSVPVKEEIKPQSASVREEIKPQPAPVREEIRPQAKLKDKQVPANQMSIDMSKLYQFPPISLLQKGKNLSPRDGQKHLEDTARRLQDCLRTFGVNVTITDISQGPAVTRYELQPEQGVKVSRIVNLSDDIKLNLAATDIRIEAPIPGKSAIGIEVPNKENSAVSFRELIEASEFKDFPSKIAFAVGKDIAGKIVVADIAKMPHMLIAGATGSGKSVCINTLIMSILYKAHPDEVKMIMIDPKVVELSSYNGIPHLLIPVVTDPKQAAGALQWGVSEMMSRYEKFAEMNVRDMKGYNAKVEDMATRGDENAPKKLPQIVIIVDELADLMMVAPGEVEESICRLAQLARAAGIHLIIATQRPSVDVITGLIKANMPSRVAFAVSSGVDSRTILDMNGAEKLLGKGDMLFYPQGYSKPVRVQGSFVSDAEVGAVVDFLKNQQIGNVYQEEIQSQINNLKSGSGQSGSGAGSKADDKDALFADAGRFIIEKDKASIGMLQRVFKIGFNRAARIVDQLCEYGVVGEEEGTKPRKVLMSLEQFENLLEEI